METKQEQVERLAKKEMSEELWVKCKSGLTTTFLDGEGLVFNIDTRKYYVINETAAFLLTLLGAKQEGLAMTSIKNMLTERYFIGTEKRMYQDLESFFYNLKQQDLVSFQSGVEGNGDCIKLEGFNDRLKEKYLKPMIEEESEITISGGLQAYQTISQSTTAQASSI